MPEINLTEFSVPELHQLSKDINKEIERRQVEDRRNVSSQMKQLASSIGMTVEEILGLEMAKKSKTQGQPKYQNPENPQQTWTGRGKRPNWMKEALEKGKTLEELGIH